MDPIPPDAFLADYPTEIRRVANRLRAIVWRAAPEAVERVRLGWRLIGYEVPVGGRRKPAYFAYVAPEPKHVHLGFEYGILVRDPDRLLEGAHLNLRQVRFLTYRPGDPIPAPAVEELVRDAGRVARLSRAERVSLQLDCDEPMAAITNSAIR